jgi:hypothetical protein
VLHQPACDDLFSPEILEYIAVGLRCLSHNEGQLSKLSVRKRISFITKRLNLRGSLSMAQNVRMTAEDNDVLDFLNVTLTKVTDVGRFQCLS